MLRWYQDEAINSIWDYFVSNTGNPVVAMPTGTGKSHVIGGFVQRVLQYIPSQRFMIVTHVKELIEQNAARLLDMWPNAPIGIHSAGLGQRDTAQPIIFGGIASAINCVDVFGWRDLLFIDECHLVSMNADTMYQRFIGMLKLVNPNLKVVGFTATDFRLGQGRITEGEKRIFTDVCYNLCTPEGFQRLLAEGWIAPLIPKRTKTALDISSVGMHNGEFAQGDLQKAVDKNEITYQALIEACQLGTNRQSWLAFASGVEHAEHVAEMLRSFGISAAAVHSKISKTDRDECIKAFKSGALRCIVNNNVLTTGFDYPPIDMIIMLRPTMSPGLWVQMLGRGTRPSIETGKQTCLVLDFARNTQRLGPIDDPMIPKAKGKGNGEVPVKVCEPCGTYNHARVRFCTCCGAEFQFEVKIIKTAGTDELLKSDFPQVEYFDVHHIYYAKHIKEGSPPSMRVSYECGLRRFNEWVLFEHLKPMARHKAHEWWKQRHNSEPPAMTDDALQRVSMLKVPRRIRVWVNAENGKFPRVIGYEY